jgi:hypothetical protein
MSFFSALSDSLIGNIAFFKKDIVDILNDSRLFLGLQVIIGLLPFNAMVGDLICYHGDFFSIIYYRLSGFRPKIKVPGRDSLLV